MPFQMSTNISSSGNPRELPLNGAVVEGLAAVADWLSSQYDILTHSLNKPIDRSDIEHGQAFGLTFSSIPFGVLLYATTAIS